MPGIIYMYTTVIQQFDSFQDSGMKHYASRIIAYQTVFGPGGVVPSGLETRLFFSAIGFS